MQAFLNQPEATFYHVTTNERWNSIIVNGLCTNRVFVSRVGEFPILLSIALLQLPDIYETEAIVFLKLPQEKNHFQVSEIIPDNQAEVEWTRPFQNIILRTYIPIENIELMMKIELGPDPGRREFLLNFLTKIEGNAETNYESHYITERARNYS